MQLLHRYRGVNFVDTAEMYPVPTEAETQGLTDKYIGSWLKKGSTRREVGGGGCTRCVQSDL
jgi:aryl-alcohol dehydrogenase-like predicted oxidoreductase